MTPARKKRLGLIFLAVSGISIALGFALKSLNENIMFFFSPSEVVEGKAPQNRLFRMGGMVVDNSVSRPGDGLTVVFDITDNAEKVTVEYTGILPDLFREGQGIVSHGKLNSNGIFVAEEVLAKHDEEYMPPEVAEAMKTKANSSKAY